MQVFGLGGGGRVIYMGPEVVGCHSQERSATETLVVDGGQSCCVCDVRSNISE